MTEKRQALQPAAPKSKNEKTLLRQSEQRFQLMVECVKDYGIFMLDPDGYVASWNSGAEHIKGYGAEEIIGQHFSLFYPPEEINLGKPERELQIAAEVGRFEDKGWRVRKDGSWFWSNVVITTMRDESGALVGFATVIRDLTEQKRAEDALRESEERFRLMVGSVKDYGIFMLDPEGRVISWNAGAERIKGYRADEIIGEHFAQFYPKSEVERGKPAMELKVAAAEGRFEDEGWRVRKNGSTFWANVVISAVRDKAGTLLGFTKVTRELYVLNEDGVTHSTCPPF